MHKAQIQIYSRFNRICMLTENLLASFPIFNTNLKNIYLTKIKLQNIRIYVSVHILFNYENQTF